MSNAIVVINPICVESHINNAGKMWMRSINPNSKIVPKMANVMILTISIDLDFIRYKG